MELWALPFSQKQNDLKGLKFSSFYEKDISLIKSKYPVKQSENHII